MSRAQPVIVVVERYSTFGLQIDEMLTDEGYLVRLWPDGASAAASIQQEQPDLVILDLWLWQRGERVPILHQLWGVGATRHIPLVVFVDEAHAVPGEQRCGQSACRWIVRFYERDREMVDYVNVGAGFARSVLVRFQAVGCSGVIAAAPPPELDAISGSHHEKVRRRRGT
jgi:CheY-like chemotaxis protein